MAIRYHVRASFRRRNRSGRSVIAIAIAIMIVLVQLTVSPVLAQDSARTGYERLQKLGDDPSMTRIIPDPHPTSLPPFPEFRPVPQQPSKRIVRLNGRQAVVNSNIWIHPNPGVSQSEISVSTHPVNPDIVFIGSNTIIPGPNSILFGSQGWYYTSDGGATWTGRDTLPTHTSMGAYLADPSVNIDLDSNLFFGAIRFREENDVLIDRAPSPDGEWRESRVPEVTEAEDKQHTVVDRSLLSPYRNRLYTVYTDFDSSHTPYPLMFSRSTDRGVTFESPRDISDTVGYFFSQGGNIATGPNGEVYVAWSAYDDWPPPVKTRIGFNKSTDGGSTWKGARSIRTINDIRGFLLKGKNSVRTNSFPSLAVDLSNGPRNGWIYLVYAERNPLVKVWMIRSTDGGDTWSSPIKVGQELPLQINDQWFPWASVDPTTGALYVVYYDSRNSRDDDTTDVYMSSSVDGGEQFEDIRVNDVSFVPDAVPGAAFGYMGDYIGIAALNGIVWPSWNDNRTGIYQAYTSRIEFQSINSDLRISASPDTVRFGNIFNGFRDSLRCVLRNQGIRDTIDVTAISASVPWISVSAPGLRIPPGKGLPLMISASPGTLGPFAERITVTCNDPERPTIEIPITGSSVSPPLYSLSEDSLHAVLATGDTIAQSVTIRNSGEGELHMRLATSIIWMDATARSTSIPPGDSTVIDVRLKSGELNDGEYRSYITISSNDPSKPLLRIPVIIRINGTPHVKPETTLVDFGEVAIGYPRTLQFHIRNVGTYPLTLWGFEIPHAGFQVVAPESLVVAPHSSKAISITYDPAVEESVDTYLRFDSNDPNDPEVGVSVRTFGYVPPSITVTPESFRILTYRDDNGSAIVSLFNTGEGTLRWSVQQYEGSVRPLTENGEPVEPSGAQAAWVTLFPARGSIPAGRSGAFEVRIDARTLLFRSYLVEIMVSSNDPDRPSVRVQVIVTVQRVPNVTLSPNVVNFDQAYIGYPDTVQFTIRNSTVNTLIVYSASSDNSLFAFADTLPIVVPPSSERPARVTYTPRDDSMKVGTLLLTTSDRVSPVLALTMQGSGTLPPILTFAADTSASPVIFSGDTTTRSVMLYNTGSAVLDVVTVVLPLQAAATGQDPGAGVTDPRRVYLPCTLHDGKGYRWDIQKNGSILDGTDDAFDGGYALNGFGNLDNAATEEKGRELILGPYRSGTLLVTRKIYVSETSGFIRYLEILQNDNVLPLNVDLLLYTNLGSDMQSSLLMTSSGDTLVDGEDNWVVSDDAPNSGDPAVASVFSDDAYHVRPIMVAASVGLGNISFEYSVEVKPQSRCILMHFGVQRANIQEAGAAAAELAALRDGALDGVSSDERRQIVNFGVDQACVVSPRKLRIPAGMSAPVRLTYNAARFAGGTYHPVLRLVSNAPGARLMERQLTMSVVDAPHISCGGDTVRFPHLFEERRETVGVPIRNTGSLALLVSSVSVSDPDLRVLTPLPKHLVPGGVDSLMVEYAPHQAGVLRGSLTIGTDDPSQAETVVPVEASVYALPVIQLQEDTLRVAAVAGEHPSVNLTLHNTGSGPFRYDAVTGIFGTEETQEGTSVWEMNDFRSRGNIYRVTRQTILQKFGMYMDIQAPMEAGFVVFEGSTIDGRYRVIYHARDTITGLGQRMVSSGPIGILLKPGAYYFLGVSHYGDAGSYYRVAPFVVPMSFGEIVSVGLAGPASLPDSLALIRQTYTVFHQSVTTDPAACVPTVVPSSGTIAAGDSVTIGIGVPYPLPAGEYRGLVEFKSVDPPGTLARLPVTISFMNPEPPLPEVFSLSQNYPNPFNAGTMIRYNLATRSRVSLTVFNVLGQVVENLIQDRVEDQGSHVVRWEAGTQSDQHASGVYFYRLEATSVLPGGESHLEVRKMLMLK